MIDNDYNEEDLMQGSDAADEYRTKYQRAKIAISNATNPIQAIVSSQDTGQVAHVPRDNAHTFKLSKIQLPKFSRELKEWLQFRSLFKHIHEDPDITKKDKFQYLIEAIVKDSRVSVLVNSFPPTAANYDKAITSFTFQKSRFCKEDLLVEVYVREMLKLVVLIQSIKASGHIPLSNIYDKLET